MSFSPPQMSLTRTSRRSGGADALDQPADFVSDQMIDLDGDAPAADRWEQLRRPLDGLRPAVFGRLLAHRAPGRIDRRPGATQRDRDAAPAPRVAPATGATLPSSDIENAVP